MSNQGTPYFAFSIAYENRFYVIKQPLNNDLQLDIPHDEFRIETHPSQVEWVYFRGQAFDRTLCSNIVSSSRDNFVDLVVDLAAAASSSNVNVVSSVPITVSNLSYKGECFSHNVNSTVTILTNAQGYRINPASVGIARVYIRQVTAASSGLSSFATVAIRQGETITGGTWVSIPGTNLQSNTLAGASVGGSAVIRWVGDFRNGQPWNLAEGMDLSIPIGTNFIVQFSNGGIGSGAFSIVWVEQPV